MNSFLNRSKGRQLPVHACDHIRLEDINERHTARNNPHSTRESINHNQAAVVHVHDDGQFEGKDNHAMNEAERFFIDSSYSSRFHDFQRVLAVRPQASPLLRSLTRAGTRFTQKQVDVGSLMHPKDAC